MMPTAPPTALRPGSGACVCAGCHEQFRSVTGFDAHRAGPPDARRCLTPAEMRARGMSVNALGRWITARRQALPAAPAVLSAAARR